jgi:hypothetical protein
MTEHRNTPSDILFDMEDDVSAIRRLGSTLLLISTTDGLEDVAQDALHKMAGDLSDCHRDLKDKFNRLFDQIVRADGGTPEPAEAVVSRRPKADMLNVETRLSTINGLAQSLYMMADASDMQHFHSDALRGISAAIEEQQKGLWQEMFPGDSSSHGDRKEAQP